MKKYSILVVVSCLLAVGCVPMGMQHAGGDCGAHELCHEGHHHHNPRHHHDHHDESGGDEARD